MVEIKGGYYMTVKEQLQEWLCEKGLSEYEADIILEAIWEKGKYENVKIEEFWDKDISEITPTNPETVPEELQQSVLSVLWSIVKLEAQKLLYVKMENLAELIVKFK